MKKISNKQNFREENFQPRAVIIITLSFISILKNKIVVKILNFKLTEPSIRDSKG